MADVAVDLVAGHTAVRKWLSPTPLVRAPSLGAMLKLECLQKTGAYKVRGALSALTAAMHRKDYRTIIAASAGNHSAGLAWAARALGLQAVAVVPEDAPATKVARTRRLGARVIRHGRNFAEARDHALKLADSEGWRFLHAFDDPDIIAGQATVGLELAPYAPDAVVVPVGGGGLAAGVALAFAGTSTRVYGARVRHDERMSSVADGVRVARLGRLNAAILEQHLDGWLEVSDAEVRQAMRDLYRTEGWIAEGAGAVAVAAVRKIDGRRKVAVVSGGNVDLGVFQGITATPSERHGARPTAVQPYLFDAFPSPTKGDLALAG